MEVSLCLYVHAVMLLCQDVTDCEHNDFHVAYILYRHIASVNEALRKI